MHAGALPKNVLDLVGNFGLDNALNNSHIRKYVELDKSYFESNEHFNIFESLITGRNGSTPNTKFRSVFNSHIVGETALT